MVLAKFREKVKVKLRWMKQDGVNQRILTCNLAWPRIGGRYVIAEEKKRPWTLAQNYWELGPCGSL